MTTPQRKHLLGRCVWQAWTRPHQPQWGSTVRWIGEWLCPPDCPVDAQTGADHNPDTPVEVPEPCQATRNSVPCGKPGAQMMTASIGAMPVFHLMMCADCIAEAKVRGLTLATAPAHVTTPAMLLMSEGVDIG